MQVKQKLVTGTIKKKLLCLTVLEQRVLFTFSGTNVVQSKSLRPEEQGNLGMFSYLFQEASIEVTLFSTPLTTSLGARLLYSNNTD